MGRCMRWCSTVLALATLAAPPSLTARSAILVDGHSGQVLYQKDAYRPRPPASLTKILTALLAAEHERFGEAVTISRRAASVPGAQLRARAGDQVAFGTLLESMLLLSANDASIALAEHLAGSVEDFAELMNGRARELGATGSRFQNPHGLTQADHHTTAFDLALLARYALRDPLLSRLVAAREGQARELHGRWERHLRNTNRFLWSYPSADGVKTGTTAAAGRCLIASATRDGHRLLAVLLNAGDRYRDAAAILDWGFANFSPVVLVPRNALVASVPVNRGEAGRLALAAERDLRVVVPRGREAAVELNVWSPDCLRAPVRQGAVVGRVEAVLEGEVLGEVLLMASTDVRCRSPVRWLLDRLLPLLRGLALRGLG
ncbi:MAG TPA: D-alanyl-D-alanine carboxypeptidase family protein [Bacillota bacterium]|nr:D-alanyl-D-alanine carboxypeptidase family protein [Bacillota bacterium]